MKRRIIWLEDSGEIIKIYEPILNKYDFDVVSTTSVANALKLINEGQFDSLLLDIQFPNSPDEGITFLREIKKNHPLLKVVIFSSYLSAEKAMALVHSNLILGYFKKPFLGDDEEINNLMVELHKAFNKTVRVDDPANLKKKRIFIASSETLIEERSRIEQFMARKNDSLIDKGVYLQLMIWEKESARFSQGRKQEEFNKLVMESDIFFCLVFDKVGNFTKEEFSVAYKSFIKQNRPSHLFVFFKDSPINTGTITRDFLGVIELKEEIKSYQQFYSNYTSVDDLLNQFNKEIEKYLGKM